MKKENYYYVGLGLLLAGAFLKYGWATTLSILGFVLILCLVVIIHEFGHYLAMRIFGITVTDFALGFGKALWGWHSKHGTHFQIKPVLLGGYVKAEDGAVENARWYQRMIIYVAGMFMNALVGGLTLAILYVTQVYDQGLRICLLAAAEGFQRSFVGWVTCPYLIYQALHQQQASATLVGPVGIAQMIAPSLKQSVTDVVAIFATLNCVIAGCNLVPIPALDGGRMLLVPFEKLMGKKALETLIVVFYVLLILLFVWVTAKDILRLFGL